jgi:GNAT superfamily N-acetyltransferase
MPHFIGHGLGGALLGRAVDDAWQRGARRLWVHTCTLDHPRALRLYQRTGFVPYKQETKVIDDPRALGLIPANVPLPQGARLVPPG